MMDGKLLSGAALMAWAMQRRCRNPHSKLLLIAMSDWFGQETCRDFEYAKLGDFSGLDTQEIMDALYDLSADGWAYCHQDNFETVSVALPWHTVAPPPPRRPNNTQRQMLWAHQEGRCWYCGCGLGNDCHFEQDETGQWVLPSHLAYPEIEHQHPRAKGGRSNRENLVLACVSCNRDKRDRTVEEYRAIKIARHGPGQAFKFHGEGGQ